MERSDARTRMLASAPELSRSEWQETSGRTASTQGSLGFLVGQGIGSGPRPLGMKVLLDRSFAGQSSSLFLSPPLHTRQKIGLVKV